MTMMMIEELNLERNVAKQSWNSAPAALNLYCMVAINDTYLFTSNMVETVSLDYPLACRVADRFSSLTLGIDAKDARMA